MPKPSSCRGCPLERLGTGWVPLSRAASPLPIMGVGEAPGEAEARLSRPFVGASGILLDKLFRLASLDRSRWSFHNVLSCRPPNNVLRGAPYRNEAIRYCSEHLQASIQAVQPRVIVAFGDTALERLTGQTGIQRNRGYIFTGPFGIPVVATFHPAYLLPGRTNKELRKDRPSRFMGTVLRDLLKASQMAAEPWKRSLVRYLVDPSPSVLADFALQFENQLANRGPDLLLTYDIETPGKQPKGVQQVPMLSQPITRIAFAFEETYAISVPWRTEYLKSILRLLSTEGTTTGWNNWNFDDPVITNYARYRPFQGPNHDMMRAWHVLESDLPKDLEFVTSFFSDMTPWKHLKGIDEGRYNCCDADAQIRNSYGIRAALQKGSGWSIYKEHIEGIHLFMEECGDRGLPLDREAQKVLQIQLEGDLVASMKQVHEIVPLTHWKSKLYVRRPLNEEATAVTVQSQISICSCGAEKPSVVHYRDTKKRPACTGTPSRVDRPATQWRVLPDLSLNTFKELHDTIEERGFNALSSYQVTNYANTYRHLELLAARGVAFEGLDDTTLGQLVKYFGKTHPIYALTRSMREATKKLTTYIFGYQPDEKGFIYTQYNDNPSTLRFGSSDVNTQNIPDATKATIYALPGFRFVECDSSAIEALMVGFEARDPLYIRLAAKGVHDFLNCKANDLPFDPDGIKRSKTLFKDSRNIKKRTVHLSNYGGTPFTMRKAHPETYVSAKVANDEQQFYFANCPTIQPWQSQVRSIVARTHKLVNPWGFIQYFHEVADASGNPGEDWNRCLGAGPQSDAAFVMRESLDLLSKTDWRQYARANVTTHDSIALMVPDALTDGAIAYLIELMGRPIPTLDNMRIGCEVKIGKVGGSWADMQVVERVEFDPLALSTWHLRPEPSSTITIST